MSLAPRVVLVHRRSEYDELLAWHGTRGAAEFYLRTRGRDLDEVQARHEQLAAAVDSALDAVPLAWRRGQVERADLDRFGFAAEDIVVVVGPDGLVANVSKYLAGQPVLGVDPSPGSNAGVLVTLSVDDVQAALADVAAGQAAYDERCMVTARLDDGQELTALNEVFIGHPSHQSARYLLHVDGREERQSSSGLIVGTATGATGWCRSISLERGDPVPLPREGSSDLAWFTREAWPSPITGTALVAGRLAAGEALRLRAEVDGLVVFGDGVEADRLVVRWGQSVEASLATTRLRLVRRRRRARPARPASRDGR